MQVVFNCHCSLQNRRISGAERGMCYTSTEGDHFTTLPRVASYPTYQTSVIKNFTLPFLKYKRLRAILRESEAKLEMKKINPPSVFVWR